MNFKDPYGSARPVIVIEPTRPGAGGFSYGPTRPDPPQPTPAVNPETATAGKGFGQWLRDEGAWGLAHFFRALFTVVVCRGFYHLFTRGIANQQAYDQAPDLWTKGKKESGFRRSGAGYYQGSPGNGTFTAGFGPFRPTSRMQDDPPWWTSSRQAAGATEPRGGADVSGADMRLLGRVGPYSIFDNRTVLDRATQFWCCPLLYRTPCENCRFMVPDQSGTNHCAAVVKANMLRESATTGKTLRRSARRSGGRHDERSTRSASSLSDLK